MPVKIALLMDNRSDENWGSQATTAALVRLLMEAHPHAEIVGIPRAAARPASSTARRLVEKLATPVATRSAWGGRLGRWCAEQLTKGWLSAIEEAELIVVNGEGTLHSQRQTLCWLPALDYVAERLSAPLWIVNTTVEVENPAHRPLFVQVLGKVERLVVREPVSLEVARS